MYLYVCLLNKLRMPISEVKNMDCMEAMKGFPDKYFDLAVVDPPYGIGEDGSRAITRNRPTPKYPNPKPKSYKGVGWDTAPINKFTLDEITRVSKAQVFWGANHYSDILPHPSSGWIYWDKDTTGDFSDGELAWTSFNKALRRVDFLWSGFRKGEKTIRIHPTEKPVFLYRWILQNYAKPGDKILDTHLGSGSSRIAAWDMGFDFWGYELDADYFAAMEARFQAHISKPVLFSPDQMYNFEQKKLFEE